MKKYKSTSLKIWHISDTHTYHHLLNIPSGIDLVIFSGDSSNNRDEYLNEHEVLDFIDWYKSLDIKYKIYVAGNHDTSIEGRLVRRDLFEQNGIIYLEDESIIINGIKFYGSPITPTFGNWAFMRKREKIYKFWDDIDDDTDVLITHGPPKNILDLTYERSGETVLTGCSNLAKRVMKLKKLKLHCFGHIHNFKDIKNQGIKIIPEKNNCIFSNGSVVEDGRFGWLTSNGNIFRLTKRTIKFLTK